jgi:hypothetical protein
METAYSPVVGRFWQDGGESSQNPGDFQGNVGSFISCFSKLIDCTTARRNTKVNYGLAKMLVVVGL